MLYSVVFVLSFIYGYLAWHSIRYALAGLLFLLPSYLMRFDLFGIPMTFLEVMILILFGVWIIKSWQTNKKIFKTKKQYIKFLISYTTGVYDKKFETYLNKSQFSKTYLKIQKPVLLFILAGLLSVSVAPDTISAFGIFKAYIVEPLIVLIIFLQYVRNKSDFYFYIQILGLSGLFVSLVGILQYFTQTGVLIESYHGQTSSRITSVFDYPNAIGLYLVPILALLTPYVIMLFDRKGINSWRRGLFWSIIIILGLFTIYFAKTEAALVAYFAVLVLYLLKYNWYTRCLAAVGGLLFAIGIYLQPQIGVLIQEKLLLQDFSGQIRQHTYENSFNMLQDHAIFGAGLSGYQEAMIPYHQDVMWIGKILQPVEIYLYPHNIVLNFWSELGVLGVIVIIFLLFKLMYHLLRKYNNPITDVPFFALLVILIHGLVDVPFFKNDLAVLLWIIIGFGLVVIYQMVQDDKNCSIL